jgi:hypothetical protein
MHGWIWTIVVCLAGASVSAAAPSAHAPDFTNRQAWPLVTGKEAFVTETWPAARLLVWAHPGKAGDFDPAAPANWLENGKPAAAPPDRDTDVFLPDADTPYTVGKPHKGQTPPLAARHVTVGRNAHVGVHPLIGNLWIKEGGKFHMGGNYRGGGFKIAGNKHTFVRNDNRPGARTANGVVTIAQWITVEKYKGASVEFLGHVSALDELKVNEGVAIVGPESVWDVGPMSVQIIGPEASLILMSGAYFGKRSNNFRSDADILVQGKLLGGTAERPLTRDAVIGISFKSILLDFRGDDTRTSKTASPFLSADQQASYGLIVEPKGALKVHSQGPARARLMVQWHGHDMWERGGKVKANPEAPRAINLLLLGDIDLTGVGFDHLMKEGIELPDPAARSKWQVYFGKNNAGKPDELFAKYVRPVQPSR